MYRKLHCIIFSWFCILMMPFLSSCINDDKGGCVQYVVSTRLVDKSGKLLPDSIARLSSAYMFLNGKYSHSVPYGSDRFFHISFNGCDDARLVVFADRNIQGFRAASPSSGTDICSLAVSLDSLSQPEDSARQSRLYYGIFNFSDITPEETDTAHVVMADRLARVHIAVAKDIASGTALSGTRAATSYLVVITGMRTGMQYDGQLTGSTASATSVMELQPDRSLLSSSVLAMFACGEPLTVSVYRDGSLMLSTTIDSEGNALEADSGDDKVFVINIYDGTLGIRVMPWKEYISQSVIMM